MRFFTLLYTVSFAASALAAHIEPGGVARVYPSAWGITAKKGGRNPHPVAVVGVEGEVAEVAQLSHKPPPGHHIQTDRIMPSLAVSKNGQESITNLSTHKVKTGSLRPPKDSQPEESPKMLKPEELDSLRVAVKQAKVKKELGDQAAEAARERIKRPQEQKKDKKPQEVPRKKMRLHRRR